MSETNDRSNWHQDFIASHLLVIGYNAWAGHLSQKRGAIVCSTNSPTVGIGGESFKTHFVGLSRLAPFLNAWAATLTAILPHHFMNAHTILHFCMKIRFIAFYRRCRGDSRIAPTYVRP